MKISKLVFVFPCMAIVLASFTDAVKPDNLPFKKMDIQVNDTLKMDAETGLIIDEKLEMVKAHCTGCHSTKLIQQHRFTREGWIGKIRWMQTNHNLWDLGESEKVVLDYLEKYYSPESAANKIPARRTSLQPVQWYKL